MNGFIKLITILIVIGITIGILHIAFPEWTTHLVLSAAVLGISEIGILCAMGFLPVINFKNAAIGMMINIFAALLIIWTIIGFGMALVTYAVGLLIIAAVMTVIMGMTGFGVSKTEELNDEVEAIIDRKRYFATAGPATAYAPQQMAPQNNLGNLTSMWMQMQSNIQDFDTKKRVRVLVERIQALPANAFPNPVIEAGMQDITMMSRTLASVEDQTPMLNSINNKVTELTNYIKSI